MENQERCHLFSQRLQRSIEFINRTEPNVPVNYGAVDNREGVITELLKKLRHTRVVAEQELAFSRFHLEVLQGTFQCRRDRPLTLLLRERVPMTNQPVQLESSFVDFE